MRWRVYEYEKPIDGMQCIVARPIKLQRPRACILTYHQYGNDIYWLSKTGDHIKCVNNDHWYYLDDIIENVENMLLDEVQTGIEMSKYRYGD